MYSQTRLPILMGHDISDERTVIALSPTVFQSGLARLHAAGFRTIGLEDVGQILHDRDAASGQAGANRALPFPARALAITFDDGSETLYQRAFPILQQYGFSATIFLTVGDKPVTDSRVRLPSQGRRTMLSWGEIREMQRYGITFGAHTLTHPNLTRLPREQAEVEICRSQQVIADALGVAVRTFAYPYGYYDQRTREIVSQHFVCACSVRMGLVTTASDPYALERVDTHYLRTERLFALMISPWFPHYVRARAIPRRIRLALHWRMG